jgi:succinoglycan biosynthesis protein ExoL
MVGRSPTEWSHRQRGGIVDNNGPGKNGRAEVFLRFRQPALPGSTVAEALPGDRGRVRGLYPGGRRKLVFFSPDLTDVSTSKRAQGFLDHGFRLTVFGFRRTRYNRTYEPTWPYVALGRTEDGNYWQRIRALICCLPRLVANRWLLNGATIVYARNIDQLLLALLTRLLFARQARIAYEVLDIPPALVADGLVGRTLRWLERLCMRRIGLLVVSSPAYFACYYATVQGYRRPWFLLENKVDASVLSLRPRTPSRPRVIAGRGNGYKWTVAYVGLIRGQETFELIRRIAARLRDTVLFEFHGVLTTVDPERFRVALRDNKNMIYRGAYINPRDLRDIYERVDFSWALDLEHVDHNSRWLRPCRFYEAGLYGVPCVAIREFEIGQFIESMGVGWTFSPPYGDQLVRFFETLSPIQYEARCRRLQALPVETFVARDDMASLCRLLSVSERRGFRTAGERRGCGSAGGAGG